MAKYCAAKGAGCAMVLAEVDRVHASQASPECNLVVDVVSAGRLPDETVHLRNTPCRLLAAMDSTACGGDPNTSSTSRLITIAGA